MSVFADCYPESSPETVAILATTSPRDHHDLTGACHRCGHLVLLHSEDRACVGCEQMDVMATSFDPLLTRLEHLERANSPVSVPLEVQRCEGRIAYGLANYHCRLAAGHLGHHMFDWSDDDDDL